MCEGQASHRIVMITPRLHGPYGVKALGYGMSWRKKGTRGKVDANVPK